MKLMLFGTGDYYEIYKPLFRDFNIVALLDNNLNKTGKYLDGIPVVKPEDGIKLNFDAIVILSSLYANEMRAQLRKLGIENERVYTYTGVDLISLLRGNKQKDVLALSLYDCHYVDFIKSNKLRIAILAHDLHICGATIALLDIVAILRDHSYDVTIVSMRDGRLKEDFLKLEIPVMIDSNLYYETLDDVCWKNAFDLLFINTIHFYHLFLRYSSRLPVVWWLHDSEMIYGVHKVESLNNVSQTNISVYAVGELAKSPFMKACPSWEVKTLLYGKKDLLQPGSIEKSNDKIIFAIVGTISLRKGHEIFIEAIKLLPDAKRKKCEFWIIGRDSLPFATKILSAVNTIREIRTFGEVDESTLLGIYRKISVLVCPSLEDTMPGVCVEAMMYYHPCIVSDNTGMMDYVKPGKNGLICRAGDAEDLAKKMEWMIEHVECIHAMGEDARMVYEEEFALERFERNLLNIIEKKINH